MIYTIKKTSKFKQDYKLCIKRGLSIDKFIKVLSLLEKGMPLPEMYQDHPLKPSRNYLNCRELHIEPDWLLIYKYSKKSVILYLIRTGSHSDLFI